MDRNAQRHHNKNRYIIILGVLYVTHIFVSRYLYGEQHSISSRYTSSAILFLIPLEALFFLLIDIIHKKICYTVLISLGIIHILSVFSPFRDKYVDDFREQLAIFNKKSDFIVVPEKEQSRSFVTPFSYREVIPTTNANDILNQFLLDYRYWGQDILILQKKRKTNRITNSTFLKGQHIVLFRG